jgi:peptidoglycan pentaglycine glycine transferase (the first glycine)
LEVIKIGENDRDFWDSEVVKFAMVHPLNAFGWGRVRSVDGWQPNYYLAKDNGRLAGMIMVLEKKIPYLGFSIMYAPKGPVWDQSIGRRDVLRSLFARIRADARKRRTIFLRIDPNLPEDIYTNDDDPFISEGFKHLENRWSFWNSPRDVYRIDLTKARDVEELFNKIDRDARRCVRKAHNEGLTIRSAENLQELMRFYEIFSQFSVGKGFMSRAYEYQESLWKEFIVKGNGALFLAIYQGEVIGGLICLLFGDKCLAMHMGTPFAYQRFQPSYAYLWESIKWAKERGCVWYSFRGTGTTPTQESFKRKFSPQAVRLVGYYDLPLRPLLYKVFYFCEFEVLPRAWRSIMKFRKGYKWFEAKLRTIRMLVANN